MQIASINYNTNVVTLSVTGSWGNGDPVMVKGMEDIGALPCTFSKPFDVTNATPAL